MLEEFVKVRRPTCCLIKFNTYITFWCRQWEIKETTLFICLKVFSWTFKWIWVFTFRWLLYTAFRVLIPCFSVPFHFKMQFLFPIISNLPKMLEKLSTISQHEVCMVRGRQNGPFLLCGFYLSLKQSKWDRKVIGVDNWVQYFEIDVCYLLDEHGIFSTTENFETEVFKL